jgi:hypothetical protein
MDKTLACDDRCGNRKKPYTPPRFTTFHPHAVQAKKLAQVLASGSDDECLKLIRQMESHPKLKAG